MRVAFFAESFLPQINGVTNTALRVLEHLRATGHDAVIVAPADGDRTPRHYVGFPVITFPSLGLPGYSDVRVVGASRSAVGRLLTDYQPDVVHLAAPFALGYKAALAAAELHLPSVAIYQTEIPSYAARYNASQAESILWRRVVQTHSLATITLAPSTFARDQLINRGVPRVGIWARGVDAQRFQPSKRDLALHDQWAPNGERVIGYLGRLANEKQVQDLAAVADLPGTRLVIIGDGPERASLEDRLPGALFLGGMHGEPLAQALATFDLFVHTGELETFGQTLQEAMASGVPVIAPARGGPLDIVDHSRTGWLYPPGDLAALRTYVADLIGDDAKRTAFGSAALESVAGRTWAARCSELVDHYHEAIALEARMPRPPAPDSPLFGGR